MTFADTTWWVAWALPRDGRHDAALATLTGLRRGERFRVMRDRRLLEALAFYHEFTAAGFIESGP